MWGGDTISYTVDSNFSLTIVTPSCRVVNSMRPSASLWRSKTIRLWFELRATMGLGIVLLLRRSLEVAPWITMGVHT